MNKQILVIGESLIDVVDRGDGTERARHVGGSPLNVAFGLGRLGIPTRFATEYGEDEGGDAIDLHLAAAGVRVEWTDDRSRPTSTAIAHIGPDGSASYRFDLEWRFRTPPQVPSLAAVHVGSIGALRMPGSSGVLALVEALSDEVLVTFDPNIRPALIPSREQTRDLVERYAARADIVKLSDEDAEWLYPGNSADASDILLDRGARLVVTTQGAAGSTLRTRAATVHAPARSTDPVDTIGAGDAYMAGLLAAVIGCGGIRAVLDDQLTPADLAAIGRYASSAAAITVGRAGAMPPTAIELERHLQQHLL
ncbi:carbohydrate kinase family protein [Humibacter sp.]|uniref:carbohydrate kinase family protein n=1 Tax=Humibacter sp. TaxID=1940291 RepID=UPI003F7D1C23